MSTVATFDSKQAIAVTPEAARYLKQQLGRNGGIGVRLGVRDSGCSGYKHLLEPVAEVPGGSITQQIDHELTLFVGASRLPQLSGTTLRFVREGCNAQIEFEKTSAGEY